MVPSTYQNERKYVVMKDMTFLSRSLLAFALASATASAATALSWFGWPSADFSAGVICPPAISQTAFGGIDQENGRTVAVASVGCPNGTNSQASANMTHMTLSGESFQGGVSGAPSAVINLLPLVTPTREYSTVLLLVDTMFPVGHGGDEYGVYHEFDVLWHGSDPGTALRLQFWDYSWVFLGVNDDPTLLLDITRVGPTNLRETFGFTTQDVWGLQVEGSVIATSKTPEPSTVLLTLVSLLMAGVFGRIRCVTGRPRH
ncbi:MAG: hypothetical protein NTV70_14935 [Acidobacteria bacterium]|nr:hypothetical protein [Acidobacteriota bacterium]